MHSRFLSFAAFAAVPLLGVGLAAQGKLPRPLPHEVDVKTPRLPDPHKGMGEVVAFTGDPPAAPERRSDIDGPLADQLAAQQPAAPFATVVWSTASDGRTWASGATYKASFGTDGFTYVPFFGADAPRNYPVRFVLRRVEVGGRDLAFDAGPVAPERTGDRVVFRRGPVQEVYDAGPRGVEQSFVVDGALPGDVVVEIDVEGDLVEDESLPGIQFGNALGRVEYGDAFVVDGGRKLPIHSTYAAGSIRLHVPASQRTAAAVVIDPVISTGYAATFPTHDFHNPDVAYDATTQTYLVVWQRNYSAEDIDVFCEVRAADGSFVSGTFGVIDNSSEHWSAPRVANLNAYDRFLVVAERYVATNPAGQR
ncbi:MAG TPA: hypothetical protein VK081_03745, partial [Planctomycetota bacterium]|nr:hypothetical protein [Planctomycetota bacterium]